jgi:hypothetical protein
MLSGFDHIVLRESLVMYKGQLILMYKQKVVYIGKLCDPIEDAIYDTIVVCHDDFEAMKAQIDARRAAK